MNAKLPPGTLDKLWADANHWRGGVMYICRDDPRLIVPKRPKWGGWTLNFARPSAWLTLLVCLLSIIVPVACFAAVGLTVALLPLEAGIIIFWCVFSSVFSSPGRYEEQR